MADSRLAGWVPSPNYWPSRYGYTPLYIVMHGTDGAMPGCLAWLTDPQAGASVHYLVARDGHIYQLVGEDDSAWANAPIEEGSRFWGEQSNPNWWTLSIEHERTGGNTTPLTGAQEEASARLVADIRSRWGHLPLLAHAAICPVNRPNCPGPGFPWGAVEGIAVAPPKSVTWVHFDAVPQKVPLVFYADASFARPLYTSAATAHTLLHFDAWRYGAAVQDVATQAPDRRWYHRAALGVQQQGWTPSAWVRGNAPDSAP